MHFSLTTYAWILFHWKNYEQAKKYTMDLGEFNTWKTEMEPSGVYFYFWVFKKKKKRKHKKMGGRKQIKPFCFFFSKIKRKTIN